MKLKIVAIKKTINLVQVIHVHLYVLRREFKGSWTQLDDRLSVIYNSN